MQTQMQLRRHRNLPCRVGSPGMHPSRPRRVLLLVDPPLLRLGECRGNGSCSDTDSVAVSDSVSYCRVPPRAREENPSVLSGDGDRSGTRNPSGNSESQQRHPYHQSHRTVFASAPRRVAPLLSVSLPNDPGPDTLVHDLDGGGVYHLEEKSARGVEVSAPVGGLFCDCPGGTPGNPPPETPVPLEGDDGSIGAAVLSAVHSLPLRIHHH
mmetsp:Transcript_21002/g.49563  ORF Transcript_21002/g.49563 Transcript_21002/m.49563 type:complete len:210 (+) Transcript_21002:117-746(+)